MWFNGSCYKFGKLANLDLSRKDHKKAKASTQFFFSFFFLINEDDYYNVKARFVLKHTLPYSRK